MENGKNWKSNIRPLHKTVTSKKKLCREMTITAIEMLLLAELTFFFLKLWDNRCGEFAIWYAIKFESGHGLFSGLLENQFPKLFKFFRKLTIQHLITLIHLSRVTASLNAENIGQKVRNPEKINSTSRYSWCFWALLISAVLLMAPKDTQCVDRANYVYNGAKYLIPCVQIQRKQTGN